MYFRRRLEIRKWSLINEMSRVEDIGSFNNYLVHNFRKFEMETRSAPILQRERFQMINLGFAYIFGKCHWFDLLEH